MLTLDDNLDFRNRTTTQCESLISIIILCNILVDDTKKIEKSISLNKRLKDYKIIIVEYGLNDDKENYKEKEIELNSNIFLYRSKSRDVSKAYNLGASMSDGKFLFFLNSDINLLDLEINEIERILTKSNDECIVPVIKDINSGERVYGGTLDENLNYIWITDKETCNKVIPLFRGIAFIIKKNLFQSIGGFNENFKSYGIEDYEFSMRLWTFGYKAIVNEKIEVTLNNSIKPIKNYGTTQLDIIYNYLCLAYLHFSEKNFCKVLKMLNLKKKTPLVLAMISTDYRLRTLRDKYIEIKKFNDNNFFEEFCIKF